MAKDVRALRDEATAATAGGKHKRALVAYLELERMEPRDAQWPKRAAETLRRLGKDREAIDAYERSAERYAQSGFLVQAMAVCKIILQIDPKNPAALRRLADVNEQVGAGPTRAANLADNNPTLHEDANVAAIRRANNTEVSGLHAGIAPAPSRTQRTTQSPPLGSTIALPRTRTSSRNRPTTTTPPIAQSRTKSRPINLPENQPIDSMTLAVEIPKSESERPGVHEIPIDLPSEEIELIEDVEETISEEDLMDEGRPSVPVIEVEEPDTGDDPYGAIMAELDEQTELELDELEDIPLPEPRAIAQAAARALASTPLFAGLPSEALEALVEELQLVSLDVGEVLFREGDAGDALYVIAEGEVSIQAEGPPRVEMARLGPGTFLGEVALMTDQPRSATVIAGTPAELLRIDRGTVGSPGTELEFAL